MKSGKKAKQKNIRFILGAVVTVLAAAAVWVVFFHGEGLKRKPVDVQVNEPRTLSGETPTAELHSGQARSRLTGLWCDADTAANVPYAVMYSNIYDAMPQSSIASADVIFESLVEGGITRLCCLFENQTALEKIGPVRSCRTYYLLFAKEFEAVYVHFGYSDYAAKYLSQSRYHSLDGMVYCSFYRSQDRVAPHNAYTSWDGITASAEEKGYDLTYPAGYIPPLKFNTDDVNEVVLQQGHDCAEIYIGYPYNHPWFAYDAKTGQYLRYQFDGPQVDAETGEQLAFKNVLIKYVAPSYYENGTPNYKIDGSGQGLYVTNGRAQTVTWVKGSEQEGPTKYYYSDGTEVVFNQGKTFICQVETTQGVTINENK